MKIKKVVVAAAGQGTRMLGLSKDKSKHLICVNNRPFLAYLMDQLVLAGYDDVILVAGFKKELIEEFAKNYLAENSGKFPQKFLAVFPQKRHRHCRKRSCCHRNRNRVN